MSNLCQGMTLNIEPLTFSSKHKESHVDSQLSALSGLGLVSALRICLVLLSHGLSLDRPQGYVYRCPLALLREGGVISWE